LKQRCHEKEERKHGMQQLLASDVLADGRSGCCFSVVSKLAKEGHESLARRGETPATPVSEGLF